MTYTPSKFPPAAAVTIAGTDDAANVGANATLARIGYLTVTRTGYWAAAAYVEYSAYDGNGTGPTGVIVIRYNTVQQAAQSLVFDPNDRYHGIGTYVATPVLITSGQLIEAWASTSRATGAGILNRWLQAWFCPVAAYPQ